MGNYYRKEITLNSIGVGTIDVMEWIRENQYPDLNATFFYGDAEKRQCLIVSEIDPEIDSWKFMLSRTSPLSEWFEYNGMHCYFMVNMWIFEIDGHYYYATT